MKRYLSILCQLLFLLIISANVSAFEKHAYVNVEYMSAKLEGKDFDASAEPTAAKLILGKAVTRFTRIEGVFVFGIDGDTFISKTAASEENHPIFGDYVGNVNSTVKLKTMFGLNLVLNAPLSDFFELYAKVGLGSFSIENNIEAEGLFADGAIGDVIGSYSEDFTSGDARGVYSLGGSFLFGSYGALTMEYMSAPKIKTKIEGEEVEYKLSSVNVGYTYSF